MAQNTLPKKYEIIIDIDGNTLEIKPFVINVFGAILEALETGLKKLPEQREFEKRFLLFNFSKQGKERLQFTIGTKKIATNPFVQEMFFHTISGFLSTLNNVPKTIEDMKNAEMNIEYRKIK